MAEMHAVRKTTAGPGLEYTTTEVPTIKPDEVLVKIKASSICGSDIHIYDWESPWDTKITPPLTTGHEGCGEVVEVGSDVTTLVEGDFISAESHWHCGECDMCKAGLNHVCRNMRGMGMGGANGTFAQYLAIPARSVWKTDKSIPPKIATFQEPLGNAVYTVEEGDVEGKNVVVFGGGPIGLFSIGVAKALGAAKVLMVTGSPLHIELAKKMNADRVINRHEEDVLKEIKNETNEMGADVALEMSGAGAAIEQSIDALHTSGKLVALGLPTKPINLDWSSKIVLKDIELKGIYGRRIWDTWKTTTRLLSEKLIDIEPLITHEFKQSEFEKGFEAMKAHAAGKVILWPEN
jgi:threonine 3-dehydrogenase